MTDAERIAFLEGRVAALEQALERRSHEQRELERHLAAALTHLIEAARLREALAAGLADRFFGPNAEQRRAHVRETLETLWDALASDEGAAAPWR